MLRVSYAVLLYFIEETKVAEGWNTREGLDYHVHEVGLFQVVQAETPRVELKTVEGSRENWLTVQARYHFLAEKRNHVVFDVIQRCILNLIVIWQTPYLTLIVEGDINVMLFLKTVSVCLCVGALTLEVLAASETRVYVQIVEGRRANLLEIEIECVSLDLSQVRAVSPRPLTLP